MGVDGSRHGCSWVGRSSQGQIVEQARSRIKRLKTDPEPTWSASSRNYLRVALQNCVSEAGSDPGFTPNRPAAGIWPRDERLQPPPLCLIHRACATINFRLPTHGKLPLDRQHLTARCAIPETRAPCPARVNRRSGCQRYPHRQPRRRCRCPL